MLTDQPPGFGALLRRHRVAAGLTQESLAARAGLSMRGLSDLERGARRLPRPDTVQRIARALGLRRTDRAALVAAGRGANARDGGQPASDRPLPTLPLPLTSFVGRERELAEVHRLLATSRLLTLTGSGGVGKTRLALRVAERLVGSYPEGVWLVELAPLADPDLVPRMVAGALRVPEQPRRGLHEVLGDALRHRRMLLVLDNCEHVVEACAALTDWLLRSCPSLTILATSRELLGVTGEISSRVPSLLLPEPGPPWSVERLMAYEAVQLFVERARAVVPNFALTPQSARAVVHVCRRLDGVPLAIELAAARVRVLAPEQLAARLDDRLGLLTGGSRSAPPRQQTLRATLEWSYELLDESERRLFERLSVFAGGWTLEAVEAVCGLDVLDTLTRLVDRSLVLVEPMPDGTPRYRLLETVRQYALEHLAKQPDAEAVRARHVAFFVALAEEFEPKFPGPDWTPRLDRLERDHDNLRVALRWLVTGGEAVTAQRLGAALALFWFLRGYRVEGRTWLVELLALQGGTARSGVRAKLLFGVALIALHQGDYGAVQSPAEEALDVWRELGDKVWVSYTLYVLGLRALWTGDRMRAARLFGDGVDVARSASEPIVEAFNLRGLALVALDEGAYAEARVSAQQALAAATHPRSVCQALNILGEISYREGQYDPAGDLLQASVAKARSIHEPILVSVALPTLGHVLINKGDTIGARMVLVEGVGMARDHGDRQRLISVLEGFAHLAATQRQVTRSVRLLGAAKGLREALGSPRSPAEQAALARWLDPGRAAMAGHAADVADAEGWAMSMEEAIAYALAEDRHAARMASPGRLTQRESEVAALVAEGLTNLEIAERLVVSERTVESHVSNVLRKLSLDTRTRLAAWVVEQRLPVTPA